MTTSVFLYIVEGVLKDTKFGVPISTEKLKNEYFILYYNRNSLSDYFELISSQETNRGTTVPKYPHPNVISSFTLNYLSE